jgi:hypothetical protein
MSSISYGVGAVAYLCGFWLRVGIGTKTRKNFQDGKGARFARAENVNKGLNLEKGYIENGDGL